jgi:hypothetical protein
MSFPHLNRKMPCLRARTLDSISGLFHPPFFSVFCLHSFSSFSLLLTFFRFTLRSLKFVPFSLTPLFSLFSCLPFTFVLLFLCLATSLSVAIVNGRPRFHMAGWDRATNVSALPGVLEAWGLRVISLISKCHCNGLN